MRYYWNENHIPKSQIHINSILYNYPNGIRDNSVSVIGDRRKTQSELTPAPGEPPVKRSRADSFPNQSSSVPANVTVTNVGLLQIAESRGTPVTRMAGGSHGGHGGHGTVGRSRDNLTMTTLTVSSGGNIPGIPTPNLSGVLTGKIALLFLKNDTLFYSVWAD